MSQSFTQKKAREIWSDFLTERWFVYTIGVLTVLITNWMQILAPKNIGWIVDFFNGKEIPTWLIGQNKEDTFFNLFLVLLLSRLLINVTRFGWRITLGRQTHHAAGKLKRDVWEHVRYFKRDDLNRKFTKGVLMNATASDTNSARFVFGFTIVAIADVFFLGLFTLITMAQIHVGMTLTSFLLLLFVPLMVKKLSQLEIDKYRKVQDLLSQFNDLASQAVSTIKMQRLTQTGPFWEKRLFQKANSYREERLGAQRLNLFYLPLMGSATILSYLILFFFGIHQVLEGQMSAGDFISMQGLMFLLHDPMMALGFIISEWRKGFTALERLSEIYFHEKDKNLISGTPHALVGDEILKVEEVTHKFSDAENTLFTPVSFVLHRGDRLGITGAIGSGKSTLLGILAGLQTTDYGKVNFYGRSLFDYEHDFLRQKIALVHQKAFLFADTIRANISLDGEMSDDEIWHYLELAGLKDDVEAFPDKLDTALGEWGINLSGGQKQRLTLARALSKKPDLLFLDDCLSAVDTLTEEKILKNLNNHLKETTLVWVAHRKSTLKYCSRIIEMGDGHSLGSLLNDKRGKDV